MKKQSFTLALTLALALTLVHIPIASAVSTDISAMHARREIRKQRRLGNDIQIINVNTQQQPQQQDLIRFQRQVMTRPFSPRRFRNMREVQVTEVIDGSVFIGRYPNGKSEVIRILGAEAPLIVNASRGQYCYSQEAKAALADQILGQTVILQKTEYHRDNLNRRLYYVQLGGRDVGNWMIRRGFAFADREHNHERIQRYVQSELDAREDDIGLWYGVCDYDDDPFDHFQVIP